MSKLNQLVTRTAMAAAAVAACTALAPAWASSHREAPFITTSPKVDATDFYMFNSYETGRGSYVTLIANYIPLQDAYGGPNYFSMDPNALYEIHIDNNGDGEEDITLQFRFSNTLAAGGKGIQLPIGPNKTMVSIPLRQAGPVTGTDDPLSYTENYTMKVVYGKRRTGTVVSAAAGSVTSFTKPIDNIGEKTIADYATYAGQYVYNISIPAAAGRAACDGRVFVGQRKEAFSVNLGRIFDLVNAPQSVITDGTQFDALNATLGAYGELTDKNTTSIAVELNKACLTAGTENVVGAWTTASLRQARLLNGKPASGLQANENAGGPWVQVSRLGMPLVNEVVIGLKDKDKFNASRPVNDAANFADYVFTPTLPALIEILFPDAKAPTNFPRTDLIAAFLTGIKNVNQPAGVKPAEMLRLNTSIPATPIAMQKAEGVLAGDNAGFPNGRRPFDDVVDLSLRVAMGKLCVATGGADALAVGCKPADAPAGIIDFVDAVRAPLGDFMSAKFPYLNTPIPGATQ